MPLANPRPGGARTVEVIKTEEKGSDVNLATFLLLDAFKRDCNVAVVISNDSDLKLPIEVAQNELGIRVGVVNPHPPARRSRALQPTFFKQIRGSARPPVGSRPCSPTSGPDSQAAALVTAVTGPANAETRRSGPQLTCSPSELTVQAACFCSSGRSSQVCRTSSGVR
jgi:hypothetical protein